jgi:hypothetical protein
MAFKLLTLYDVKISQADWDTVEAELSAALASLDATADSLVTTIAALNRQLIYLHYNITELGG